MVERFLVWVGAGLIAAGLSAGMVAGAGLAIATEGSSPDNGVGTTSESSNSLGNEDDSGDDANVDADDAASETTGDSTIDTDTDTAEEEVTNPDEDTDEPAESTDKDGKSDSAETDRSPARVTLPDTRDEVVDDESEFEKVTVEKAEKDAGESAGDPEAGAIERKASVIETVAAETEETPEIAAVAFASAAVAEADAAATAPPFTGLLNLIGTIVFNLYGLVQRVAGGPPILPANSTVTVRSSTLVLECGCDEGDTIEVPADWYIPEVEEGTDPPNRLIYLQHGFLAAGPWYSHTAAALAEQTHSIVVAPTITSNFLASDACWLGASPMHQAMAKLFNDDNTALADSALAAGYAGPIPDRVVLMGHSLGGGAVAGIAGAMADNLTTDRLAGVVLLDGVGLDGTMADSLNNVPDDIPIYNLAAPRYFWNQFGVGSDALLEARPEPGRFLGVTLVKGSHVDSMRGGNPIIQFSQELVAGYSHPENAAAAQILMVGWVNDMFAGTQDDGIYLDPSEEFSFDTPEGEATVVALPNSLTKPFLLNPLQQFVSLGDGFFTFEPTCVAESMGTCTGSMAA